MFLQQYGYQRGELDAASRARVYLLKGIIEQPYVMRNREVHEAEMKLRRSVLVDGVRAFHPADMVWMLPAMISFRTADAPDETGSYGELVRAKLREGDLKVWSPSEFSNRTWTRQWFRDDDPDTRLPVQWRGDEGQGHVSAVHRDIWFPAVLRSAPWGRPGEWAEYWPSA